ncbi:MAG TPA: serine/threonine protein kinase, partial [Planctomycetes bacterium]|nr:serine/threonine protein kinase [Planctomycetota bacterium]
EAEALRQVQHEHVVRLRDLGEERGVPYLVLDYHRGGTLADLLQRGPLDPLVVTRLGIQLASALEAAHGAGVLHRDLKPD